MRRARRPRLQGATTKAMPVSIVLGAKAPCDEAERRLTRARSDPRETAGRDRAPAPPAPGGLAGLCITSYASACVRPASRRGRNYEHGYSLLQQRDEHVLERGRDRCDRGDAQALLGGGALELR